MIRTVLFTGLVIFSMAAEAQKKNAAQKDGVNIHFENTANGKRIILNDSIYTNAFGEKYSIRKLKYYISNVSVISKGRTVSRKNIFLADAAKENSITISGNTTEVEGIEFLVGVDSLLNCSGAQSGPLDPLNDMFWTWNSGYVMFKLEGSSENSTADNHRIEEHIGGYKDPFKTMRIVRLMFPKKNIVRKNITVNLDLDKFWQSQHEIRISETPVITTVGEKATRAADNFPAMFSIKE